MEMIKKENTCESGKNKESVWNQLIHYATILVFIVALCFFVVLTKAFFDGEFDSVQSFQMYIGKFGVFAPFFLIIFQAAQVILPVLPGLFGCAVGSVMFGPAVGFLCSYVGIAAGSILAFVLGRKYGKPLIELLFPPEKYSKWAAWASKSKSYTAFLFMAMLLPLFPDDYLCYLTVCYIGPW